MLEFFPFLILVFVLGLMVGSFLNVVIIRNSRSERLTGRSHCDSCGKILTWRELIPIASFVYQKGRCLYCGTVLSIQYPLVELGTGFAFAAGAWYMLNNALWANTLFFFLLIALVFIAIASTVVVLVADLRYQIIPNGAVLAFTLIGFFAVALRNGFLCLQGENLCVPFNSTGALYDGAISILCMFFFFALWFFSQGRAMGFGDVKLVGATSLILGFPASLIAFLFSFWLGGITGVILLLAGSGTLKTKIPFGPFILFGSLLAFLFSNQVITSSGFSNFL